ncbi:HSF-type DNA-binding-domain-containing protein [Lipomyces oligophaga]|uniref:HSF-type DNA-binding-domain-containing protein n=1 Tax=Lipomyces oligophaga TaxID=45792 RepID=UPI0034CF4165
MLEDPSYRNIVRWSDAGDSFVVIETNEFTKSILPRHFKHSNFASFVRQLNKYDFHKVRSTDEGGGCPYGESAWEFKHPDFQLHNKTQLDNIKRKAPAPRRAQHQEDSSSSEHIIKLDSEIEYLKSSHALLTKHLESLTANYESTLNTMVTMQRSNEARDELIRSMLSHLQTVSAVAGARATSSSNPSTAPSASGQSSTSTQGPTNPATRNVDFSHASATGFDGLGLHQSVAAQSTQGTSSDTNLDYLSELAKRVQVVSSSTSSQLYMQQQQFHKNGRPNKSPDGQSPSLVSLPTQVAVSQPGQQQQQHHQQQQHQQGIHSDANSTTEESLPDNDFASMMDLDQPVKSSQSGSEYVRRRSSKSPSAHPYAHNWAVPPKVLLVEDDATSRRVSSKFLQIFGCEADIAVDGLAAVNKMNMSKYDMVLMDIVMPHLDGVSASSLIRQFDPLTPIIAMTGNVSNNDVITYYSHGMNDVLAKPFTKENLYEILDKHLIHLKEMKEI